MLLQFAVQQLPQSIQGALLLVRLMYLPQELHDHLTIFERNFYVLQEQAFEVALVILQDLYYPCLHISVELLYPLHRDNHQYVHLSNQALLLIAQVSIQQHLKRQCRLLCLLQQQHLCNV